MEFDLVYVGSKVQIAYFWATKQPTYHKPLFATPFASKKSPTEKWETPFASCSYTKSSYSLASQPYPIFPLVTFRDIVWEQGQKASRHLAIGKMKNRTWTDQGGLLEEKWLSPLVWLRLSFLPGRSG